jgi:hypothetical protein
MRSGDALYEHGNGTSSPTKAPNYISIPVTVDFECLILFCIRDGYWKSLQTKVQVSSVTEYVNLAAYIVNNNSSV